MHQSILFLLTLSLPAEQDHGVIRLVKFSRNRRQRQRRVKFFLWVGSPGVVQANQLLLTTLADVVDLQKEKKINMRVSSSNDSIFTLST